MKLLLALALDPINTKKGREDKVAESIFTPSLLKSINRLLEILAGIRRSVLQGENGASKGKDLKHQMQLMRVKANMLMARCNVKRAELLRSDLVKTASPHRDTPRTCSF